ncbi:hypothetical protein RZO50_07110 [Microbacterium sp. SSW1-59]|uniref:hypothetical protein n=1 Tax=Microbacterium xanthum TaxID=3079794 RepID=UPI002AD2292E|nr:hypothetical protein [Microbacterium sp. SSW1-59]MDZ8201277.1 hypothetical protein [Microbacterium sp. SSW1-59]
MTVNRVVEELARREIATVVVRGTASMAGGTLSALDGVGQLVPHLSAHDGAHASVALVDDADDLDTASTSLLMDAVCRQHLVALFVVRAADTVRPPSDSGAALTGLVARGIAHRVDIEPLSERQAWDFLRPCGNAVADEVTRDAIIWWSNGSRALLDEFAALACDASREGRDPIAEVSELPGLTRLADAAGAHLAALDAGHLGTLALIHHLPGIASAHASRIRPVAELDALCAAGYLHRDEAVAHALWANPLLGREAERMLGTEHVERMLMDAVVRMLAEDGGWWSPPIAAVLADKMLRGEPLAVAVPETIGRRALRDAAAQNNDHGDFALAEAYATTGLNSAPDDIGLGLELAHARVGAGETDAVPYPVGIEGGLDRARAAQMLTLWSNRGDSANARELRAELERCRPGAEEPHLLLADAVSYFASLDWPRAQEVAQDLAARASGRWRAAAWLVEAHARAQLGDPRGAKRALARIESLVYEVGVPGLSTADRLRFLMTGLVTHLVMGEDAPGVRDHIARECRRAVREGDDRALGTAGLAVALSAAVSGDVAGAVAGLDHARTRFSPLRKDMTAATVELWISQFLARDGATRAARTSSNVSRRCGPRRRRFFSTPVPPRVPWSS